MSVTIIDIEVREVKPNVEGGTYLFVKFQCTRCQRKFEIGSNIEPEMQTFLDSLEKGAPTKYIGCFSCDGKPD